MSRVSSFKIHLNDWNTARRKEIQVGCSRYRDQWYFCFFNLIIQTINVLVTWASRSWSIETWKLVVPGWFACLWVCWFGLNIIFVINILQLWATLQPKIHPQDTYRVLAASCCVKRLPKRFLAPHYKGSNSAFFFNSDPQNNQWYSQSIPMH